MVFLSRTFSRRFLLQNSMFHGYCSQLNQLTSVALLWFPPVGFNQYSDPLRRVNFILLLLLHQYLLELYSILLCCMLLCNLSLLFAGKVESQGNLPLNISMSYLLLFPSNLTQGAYLCYYMTTIPWNALTTSHGRLILHSDILPYASNIVASHLAYYVLLNLSYACSLIFL
jgi:hypothetical protein